MIIENVKPFSGQNCEIAVIGNLLKHKGLLLSEPMLFGIGEGLGFFFWDSKQLGYPILLGRCKQDVLTENIVHSLGITLEINETTSQVKAWNFLKSKIDKGIPVGLKLDCYYLDYFTQKIHFPAHYVTMYGYDETHGYLIDTVQQDVCVKSRLSSISEARNAQGPMSSRNRAYSISNALELPDMKKAIVTALHKNAQAYLNPPISNANAEGIKKTANLVTKWVERPEMTNEIIIQTGVLMEKGGTGGGLFRNLYRDFLEESNRLFPELGLKNVHQLFCEIAPMWTEVSKLMIDAGETKNLKLLDEASEILHNIAPLEESAMNELYCITT